MEAILLLERGQSARRRPGKTTQTRSAIDIAWNLFRKKVRSQLDHCEGKPRVPHMRKPGTAQNSCPCCRCEDEIEATACNRSP